jgi:pyrroloquinoline quinone biosynthesis protein D
MTGSVIEATSVPRLSPHMRLRYDKTRGQWTIQAPERSFVLDEISYAIVSRCDGTASLKAVIAHLAITFPDAPVATIATDVIALVRDLADKGIMTAC